jgi:perosamine synthetase
LSEIIEKRQLVCSKYDEVFATSQVLLPQPKQDWATWTPWLSSTLLSDFSESSRDSLMTQLANIGIETRPLFYPVHTMAPYLEHPPRISLDVSETVARAGLSLPTSSRMTVSDAEFIANSAVEIASIILEKKLIPPNE